MADSEISRFTRASLSEVIAQSGTVPVAVPAIGSEPPKNYGVPAGDFYKHWTPVVSEEGTLTWTLASGDEPPAPADLKGEQGEQGDPGADGAPGEDGAPAIATFGEIPATETAPKGLVITITDALHQQGQSVVVQDDVLDVSAEEGATVPTYVLSVKPNSIGKEKLKDPTELIPEPGYTKLTLLTDPRGKFQVVSLADDLQSFLASIGYKTVVPAFGETLLSNVLQYTGALPQCAATVSSSKLVVSASVPLGYDVEFRVWGSSDSATDSSGGSRYSYGLTAITRTWYDPEDIDYDEIYASQAGIKTADMDLSPVRYSAVFPAPTLTYNYTPSEQAAHPNKHVQLYLSSGVSANPYQADRPSSFTLKIQAVLRPAKYSSGLITLAP